MTQFRHSLVSFWVCALVVLTVGIGYYPKWNKEWTEATLSWDVSGYYLYLPALFIYKDIKQVGFREEIHEKYRPSDAPNQAFKHRSGNYVMKYACGLAVQYLPFFGIAHALAPALGYPADGFSRPYQMAIGLGSLLVALLGLWLLRRNLLQYFGDRAVAITLLLLVLGTNYLDYAAINGAMTHNYLFTLYTALVALTVAWYRRPTLPRAAGIGLLVGLATLTRPTELWSALIPLLWGIGSWADFRQRIAFWRQHGAHLALAVVACGLMGSLQLLYWKVVSGEWLVYSYEDQGFSWLRPHLYQGIFSIRAGWLVYTPMMALAVIGFWPLFRQHRSLFWGIVVFFCLFVYVTFAWDIWWYGGSLGQRAMVQSYAVLAFPLAAFVTQGLSFKPLWKYAMAAVCVFFIYYNFWLTHQAHRGGLLEPSFMTRAYFWRIFLRYDVPPDARKLLDTRHDFGQHRQNVQLVYANNFEDASEWPECPIPPVEGKRSVCLGAGREMSEVFSFPLSAQGGRKLRAIAVFRSLNKEWNTWKMAQMIVKIKHGEQTVSEHSIRVFRILNGHETREIYIDVLLPKKPFDRAEVMFWNAGSSQPLAIDQLRVERAD